MPTLTDLALELLDREALGRGAEPDLLWISYSQTDLCGHYFGPDSHELFDAFARADRELERLLTALDAAVGKGRYVMALTSDHGVGEAPETLAAAGRDAGRVTLAADKDGRPVAFLAEIEDALSERLGKRPKRRWVRYASAVGMVLWDAELDAAGLDKAAANRALRDVLRAHPKIAAAYTQEEVERAGGDVNSPFLRQFHNSNVPSRCAGVQYVLKSGWLATTTPATHGTPHSHDTHVPLLLAGPGVRKGAVDAKAVSPLDLTPTLARILGIRAPAGCDGAVLPAFVP
jgi:arylsulfatase A-like enzyme